MATVDDEIKRHDLGRLTRRQVQDLAATAFVIIGVLGVITVAFIWNPILGAGVGFAVVAALGIVLGLD